MSKHFDRVNRIQNALSTVADRRSPLGPEDVPPRYPGGAWVPADVVEESSSSSLLDYWHKLQKRKGTLLAFVAVGILGGLIYSALQTPLYRTRTTVEIDDLNENFQNISGQDPTITSPAADSYFLTQVKVLQSPDMIEHVVTKLHYADRIAAHNKKSFWSGLIHRSRQEDDPGLSTVQQEQLVQSVKQRLVVQAYGQTRMAEIFFEDRDPQLAADFANTLVSEFIAQSREARWQATQGTAEWLSGHLNTLKKKLEDSEAELQEYARSSGIVILPDKGNVADQKLEQIQEDLSKAQAALADKQAIYELAKNNPSESLPETLNDPTMRDYRQKLTELQRQHAELSATLTPEHYKVRKLEAEIAEVQKALEKERTNIVRRTADEYQAALRQERLLSHNYDEQARTVSDVAGRSIKYYTLKHEVDTNRQLYDALLLRVKQAGLAAAMRSSNLLVVDVAKPPLFPHSPNFRMNAAIGLLAGLFLGVGFVFVTERFNRSIESPGLSPTYLNLPELGVIPMAEDSTRRLHWFPAGAPALQMTAGRKNGYPSKSHSPISEAYRGTLSSILLPTLHGVGRQVIVLTSPESAAGKTTVTSNLGVATAETGRRVLLIDADFRRPRLHRVFDIRNNAGFTDLLKLSAPINEGTPLRHLIQTTRIPGLSLVTSGPTTSAPSSLLYSPRLVEFLDRVGREFDLVLIDAPPMLQFADARVLGRYSDGVILVLRAGQTKWEAAMLACQRFNEDGTQVLGTILNNWDLKNPNRSAYADAYSDAYAEAAVTEP
jgi:succinoglycan biosynthesis transport protein ExoP